MSKKKKKKHVPQRTCIGCREVMPKRSLIRIVRTPSGIQIDPSGKISGRGAYLHNKRSCWENGLKSSIAHALRIEVTAQDKETLEDYKESLPDEDE